MSKIEIRDKRIEIDGQPRLILSGEIHYFRVDRRQWQDRIDKLKAAGCNAVASYIPWLCHETAEREFDFLGRTLPDLDLAGFIDLCRDNGLWFVARPGPFVMAELKNEGLPFRLYKQFPEIVPVTWDGRTVPSKTVDYVAPAFLAEVLHWYQAVANVLRPRLQPNGGNVIAIQLDNEVGMLSWITNSPDLTDRVIDDFWSWLERRYGKDERSVRYPADRFSAANLAQSIRSPAEELALPLLRDLGHYMRDRFARYVAALRDIAREFELAGVPLLVNVHGTAGGRGLTFPIGISQLYPAYTQSPDYLAGTDIYLGNLTAANATDLYLINAFMDAVNLPDQPLTSLEFECGDGDYGSDGSVRHDPSASDFKLRMCVAQGNRLINFYLLAGGINYRLDDATGDGNDRISFTGERHGVAAPIGPEGQINPTYPRLARSNHALMAVSDKLAVAREEHDGVAWGFLPDYFMTESIYPASDAMNEFERNLARTRFGGPREVAARAMLLAGFRFGAVDVQNRPLEPATTPVLVLASARYMDRDVQSRLVSYLNRGGRLLLVGEVPLLDMEGGSCTLLAEHFKLDPVGERQSAHDYFLSAVADGWAAPRAEMRAGWAQTFAPADHEVLLRIYGAEEACGFDIQCGDGRAIVVTADIPCDVPFFQDALDRLGVSPGLSHGCADLGIFLTSSVTPRGERFVHLLNLDGFDKVIRPTLCGEELFPGRELLLRRKEGLMLPFGVMIGETRIVASTAEIAAVGSESITFRLSQAADAIVFETAKSIVPSVEYEVERREHQWIVTSRKPGGCGPATDDLLVVGFT